VIIADCEIGGSRPLFLIAGPCVIESESFAVDTAGRLREITQRLDIPFVYKSSYDKANRTSGESYRGPGLDEGLAVLQTVRDTVGVPVLTDVHSVADVEAASSVVDVLQTPAFLCRQTDIIQAAARSGKLVNIKKGQFLSPGEMQHVVAKAEEVGGGQRVLVCERGTSFGYNNLVVDMRSLSILNEIGVPVVFDATHSVQLPGAGGDRSAGQREYVPVLARAAVACGISGLFMETHPDPDAALSDGPNSWPLHLLEALLTQLQRIDRVVKTAVPEVTPVLNSASA